MTTDRAALAAKFIIDDLRGRTGVLDLEGVDWVTEDEIEADIRGIIEGVYMLDGQDIRQLDDMTVARDELAAHVHFLRDALGEERKSVWRDVKLSATAAEAVDALAHWEELWANEWIEVLDQYDEETDTLPAGHVAPELGCSSYNWRKAILRDLRPRFEAKRARPFQGKASS